jgi:hypothetical protein
MDDFPARCTLGEIAFERGDLQACIRNYGSVLEYDPQNPSTLGGLTKVYLDTGDLANGVEHFLDFGRRIAVVFAPERLRRFCWRARANVRRQRRRWILKF